MNDFDNKQICSYKDIDRFGFTCDVCGRKVNGCSIVNGMKFCAKCYQETFGKDNQQNEIQQIKQQLEEKDKLLKCYQEEEKLIADILGDKDLTLIGSRKHLENLIVELRNKIKDKDIIIEKKDKEIENCKRNELYEENMKILAVKNQKQLAINELEKVRKLLLEESKTYPIVYDITNDVVGGAIDRDKIFEIIDNQIKELKGE